MGVGSMKAAFSGGSGTEEDPFLISNVDDLYDISTNLSAHYKLTRDLDLTEWIQDESPKSGWNPIGTTENPFKGSFDGNGKTISGLYIKRNTTNNIGLFGYIAGLSTAHAKITNLTLQDANVSGNMYVGALAGRAIEVEFSGITLKQSIVIGQSEYVGGLFGYYYNSSSEECSIQNIDIQELSLSNTSISSVRYIGFLTGYIMTYSQSFNVSNIAIDNSAISCTSNYVGALCGYFDSRVVTAANFNFSNIKLSNNTITGSQYVGGLIGHEYNTLKTSGVYTILTFSDITSFNNTITGSDFVGGILGGGSYGRGTASTSYNKIAFKSNYSNIIILNNKIYASNTNAGGIVGENGYEDSTEWTSCFVSSDVESEGTAAGISFAGVRDNVNNCSFTGNVKSTNGEAYGIAPSSNRTDFSHTNTKNIFSGAIYGNKVYGIGEGATYCVCNANLLSATSALYRIKSSTTNATNYAYNDMTLMLNGVETEVEEDACNGIDKSARLLKRKSTYDGSTMGYDFENNWAIVDTKTLPYLISQSTPTKITLIADGKVTGTVLNDNKSGVNGKVYVFVEGTMYEGTVTDGEWEVVIGTIAEGTEVKVSVETEGKKPSVIVKDIAGEASVTPGEYETVTIGSSSYATYCPTTSVDFSEQSNIKAYAATGYEEGTVVLTRIYLVKEGEGVLLKGDEGSYRVKHTDKTSYYTNLLIGVTTTTEIAPTSGDKTNFILANGTRGVGFYAVSETGPLSAGKAYLQLPTALFNASGHIVKMQFDDETSDITRIENEKHNKVSDVYDMQGRRLSLHDTNGSVLKKGFYVKQGKKFIVK